MRVGIDLGGTKIEALVLDSNDGSELARKRIDTPSGYEPTLNAIKELVIYFENQFNRKAIVGVGHPGTHSPKTGLIKNANFAHLQNKNFKGDLSKILDRDVRTANDANCLAVSEAVDGAGAGYEMVFAIILGTGCGAGIAINKKVWNGGNGIAGEWGHTPLPLVNPSLFDYEVKTKPPCYCGFQNCKETWISGTGLVNDYERLSNGIKLKGSEISELATNGDKVAQKAMDDYKDRLARSIAEITNILDPNIFVVGGGVSNSEYIYDGLPLLVEKYTFGREFSVPIVKAKYGDSSGVRGAAWL